MSLIQTQPFIDDNKGYDLGEFTSTGLSPETSTGGSPENWYSIDWEVNSNGKISDGVNYCYSNVAVDEVIVYANGDFPCPFLSNNVTSNANMPFVGGGIDGMEGTIRIREFEWLIGKYKLYSEYLITVNT